MIIPCILSFIGGVVFGVVFMAVFSVKKEIKEYEALYSRHQAALNRIESLLKSKRSLVEEIKEAKRERETIENRLKHLLKSHFISSFDSKLYCSGEYDRDIKEADEIVGLAPNNKPFIQGELLIERCENPIDYIEAVIAFDVKDWGADNRLAAIYAIILGWDNPSYSELKNKYHWSEKYVSLLKQSHTTMARLKVNLYSAHWTKCETADYNWKCSRCGYGYTDNKTSYCCDCGAMMEDVFTLSERTVSNE